MVVLANMQYTDSNEVMLVVFPLLLVFSFHV